MKAVLIYLIISVNTITKIKIAETLIILLVMGSCVALGYGLCWLNQTKD